MERKILTCAHYHHALILTATLPPTIFWLRTTPNNQITDYIQHFSYGARGFMRVPVSEANDLNYLLYAAQGWIKAPLLWPTVIYVYSWAENNTPEITTAVTVRPGI